MIMIKVALRLIDSYTLATWHGDQSMETYGMEYIAQAGSIIEAAFPLLFTVNSVMCISMANNNCVQQ